MHKRMVNQAKIGITISPVGPLLIKASDQGADPTKPDMEFVETYYGGDRSVYLPGSSLKGAIRAHCERIVRTLSGNVSACDPVKRNSPCRNLEEENSATLYKRTCTICQIFGSTNISARANIADAYPVDPSEIKLEERNGVAIDRIYGFCCARCFIQLSGVDCGNIHYYDKPKKLHDCTTRSHRTCNP